MLAVISSLVGIFLFLLWAEYLWRHRLLGGEGLRKLVHIGVFSYVAAWPWIMDWWVIRGLAISFIVALVLNRYLGILHYHGGLASRGYGDLLMPVAIIACSFLTTNKVFFSIGILEVALADGFAALIGKKFGGRWRYSVFGQNNTVIGTMSCWLISLAIIGITLPLDHGVTYGHYALSIMLFPPIIAFLENFSILGLDNLTLPIVTVLLLLLIQE